MKDRVTVLVRLMIGFILCAGSTVFMLNSNLGLSPWDVLHEGISKLTGITIGEANIIIGFLFVFIAMLFGQKVGIGTILNMIIVGEFIDFIIYIDIIPKSNDIATGIIMMLIGMLVMGLGCYYYIGCGLGCGPRDGVMIMLSNKFNKSINIVRTTMEITVLVVGYILGGTVGVASLITAAGLGYFIQIVFKMKKFDANAVEHKSVIDTFRNVQFKIASIAASYLF